MKYKLKEMLDTVDEEDLYKMRQDLSKGGLNLKKLIDEKLKENELSKSGFCITCGEDLGKKQTTYTLLFGPEDFKKKAAFCEIDCLEYFLGSLRKTQKVQIVNEEGDDSAL